MYDKPKMVSYYLGSITFTTADKIFAFKAGTEERYAIDDVEVRVTTTFAGATTTPQIEIGNSTDDDKFFSWDMGLAAAANLTLRASIDKPSAWIESGGVRVEPARDEDVYVSCKAATGSGAAGVADVWVHLTRG